MEKKKLTANIMFSGIGFQEKGIQSAGPFELEVVTTSEICKESILSYAAIHNSLTPELINSYNQYPSVDEMIEELTNKNIGYDPDEKKYYNWEKHRKTQQHIIKKYWLAVHLSHNMGDISRIKELPYADLWTISFPCQSISCAGKMKGFKPDSDTRSSLLWENIRLLKRAVDDGKAPKYLLFENVKNLVSKKFKPDFLQLLEILDEMGYNSYWSVMNAKECDTPQNRERVFVICYRKDTDHHAYTWPDKMGCQSRLEDILLEDVPPKYFFNNERSNQLISNLIENGSLPKPDGIRYALRRLTPEECFVLMGMENDDYKKCLALGISETAMYRQAGNGIVVNCIKLIMQHVYKADYDPAFICDDEKCIDDGCRVCGINAMDEDNTAQANGNSSHPVAVDLGLVDARRMETYINPILAYQRGISNRKHEGTGIIHTISEKDDDAIDTEDD